VWELWVLYAALWVDCRAQGSRQLHAAGAALMIVLHNACWQVPACVYHALCSITLVTGLSLSVGQHETRRERSGPHKSMPPYAQKHTC
jgi:hypothetical protein